MFLPCFQRTDGSAPLKRQRQILPTAKPALRSATAARWSPANQTPIPCLDLRETLPATHANLSQSAQPCTTTQLTDHSIQSLPFVESTLPGSHSVSNDLESVRYASFSGVQLEDSRRTGILMGEIPSALVGHLPEQVESTSSVAEAVRVATKIKRSRDGFVGELAQTDMWPSRIWELVFQKFYVDTPGAVRGLSKKQVTTRVNNARSADKGQGISAQVEAPKKVKKKNLRVPILVFFSLTTRGTMTKSNG
ncbi:unnamed protein product [Phytophthora fragariaefolia]|uniref:Unnamed protein product n=1 Tax=Phytophthora fragariaefolia TaxID=1490495 RepID=A0A9W6XAJ5_9STRA|nr:unnamed protein product [Phytophthora fragariaefolia]